MREWFGRFGLRLWFWAFPIEAAILEVMVRDGSFYYPDHNRRPGDFGMLIGAIFHLRRKGWCYAAEQWPMAPLERPTDAGRAALSRNG